MTVFIGRLFNIGIGKESTRGTAVAATYWIPKTDFVVEDKIDVAVDESTIGIIEDAQDQELTKKYSEGSFGGIVFDQSFGLILMAMTGTDTIGAVESGVKDHVFTLLESAQHPSLTLVASEPNAVSSASLKFTLAMLDSLNLHFEVGKFAAYKVNFRANGNGTAASTPSFISENRFSPQYCAVYVAPTIAGLQSTLTATGTAASTVNVTALSISTTLIQVGMTVTGTNVPAGATVAAIVSASAFTLSAATTGAMGSITFGPAVVNARMADITITQNIEDDPTIGSLAVVDRYNKQYTVEGSIELVYTDRSWIDTVMIGDLNKALRLIAKNTAVTIGAASNPTLTIDFNKVNITEVARSDKNNDIMLQTIKFKAFYSITDSKMVTITLRNTVTSAY